MHRFRSGFRPIICSLTLCGAILSFQVPAKAAESKAKWIRVSSDHFSVLTDAGQDKGHEVAVRLEQMRAVFGQLLYRKNLNMSEPLDVIALRTDNEYAAIAPIRQSQAITAPGFFVAGPDRDYIVLNLFEPESWLAVSHQLAHYFLNYNYPPTQPWFDEGFAEYFSSIHLGGNQAGMGSDPELGVTWDEDIFGNQAQKRSAPRSLTEQLTAPVWLSIPDLFAMHEYAAGYQEGSHHTLFYAQSWMVVHYLLNKNKLGETGTYFDLVENKKLPVPEAIQQAYGMAAAQFDQAVKDYFKSLTPLFLALDVSKQPDTKTFQLSSPEYQVYHVPTLDAGDIGTSAANVSDAEAEASVAEMELRLPEHVQQAMAQLKSITDDPKAENAIAHRALAWAHMQKKEFDQANAELDQASQLDPKDPWVHYYSALMKYRQSEASGGEIPGLANMMLDLRTVIDWDPEFAEAYNMLAMARVQGGGMHSAMDAIRPALQLSPRNQTYVLNLAVIDMAEKKWDDATNLLNSLKSSPNPQIARKARKDLGDLPTLKKYGILPQDNATASTGQGAAGQSSRTQTVYSSDSSDSEDAAPETAPLPPVEKPDKRPVKFLKGTLTSVDCSQAPAAILIVSSAGKVLKLRTTDYKSLLLIGADQFSCDWKHLPVLVNYKLGGKANGDLVSLELR
ncbi:MAG: tetratricopeptide repeat protein [Terriglobales bacterium]